MGVVICGDEALPTSSPLYVRLLPDFIVMTTPPLGVPRGVPPPSLGVLPPPTEVFPPLLGEPAIFVSSAGVWTILGGRLEEAGNNLVGVAVGVACPGSVWDRSGRENLSSRLLRI